LCRGSIPAPILFAGEAPGLSEDVLGKPFVGPAGHLLDQILDRAIDGQHNFCLTNLVACIPLGDDGAKTEEPPKESILACAPRLEELIKLCKPKIIIGVGDLAKKYLGDRLTCSIVHPAWILRLDPAQQGLACQRSVVTIEDAVADL
jgi:DNA polymerase